MSRGLSKSELEPTKAKSKAKAKSKSKSTAATRVPRSHHFHVYVIELNSQVLLEPRFRKCNPNYRTGRPCVYVGMTGIDPDRRFDKHKAGIQSNRYVKEHGLWLLPALYECYNPLPYNGARDMEVELAIALREQGYGVWQA